MNGVAKNRDTSLARAINLLGHQRFSEAFSGFARHLTAFDNLIVLLYQGKTNPVVLYREYRDPVVYRNMDSAYVESAYQLDPFYKEHLKGSVHGLRRLIDVIPSELQQTNYYTTYYAQTTLIDEVAAFADLGNGTTITACFGKDRTSGAKFSGKEIRALWEHEHVLSILLEKQWKDTARDLLAQQLDIPLKTRLQEAFQHETGIHLTPRQAEIAAFILQGYSSMAISLHLNISIQTVKVFRRQLYTKCNISSQGELFTMMMPLFSKLSGHTM
ncbi:helix-turn-helix transcriptional regulator [Desulfovibrio inopinatus]|uniref:helix-turn-helix transcriptional regulator n=1 Tax=Desulfovibrio inopinatus TaxID=102109 RepID=UPI000412725D|nr:helix-turn-helix transcriptional regulator [Desulfovibrio inopinatus]